VNWLSAQNRKKYTPISWLKKIKLDKISLLAILGILLIGLIAQSSVAKGHFFLKHACFVLLGLVSFTIGYRLETNLLRKLSIVAYVLSIGLLVAVYLIGTKALGGQRWLTLGGFSIQPSEAAKIACILMLGIYYSRTRPDKLTQIILAGVLVMLLPFGLIFLQPDLGTASVLVALFGSITFWAGATLLQLLVIFSPIMIVILSAIGLSDPGSVHLGYLVMLNQRIDLACSLWGLIYIILLNAALLIRHRAHRSTRKGLLLAFYLLFCLGIAFVGRPLAWGSLQPYQQMRLTIFQEPTLDPKGSGYNIIQSLLSIGGGNIYGQGYKQGQSTQGEFVPEQHTDFIFSSIAEEWGFAGASLLILLFLIVCWRLLSLAAQTKKTFSKVICIGAFTLIFFHIVVNIGMNMSLLPVTGVPLPLVSYGGSSMCVCLFILGITHKIYASRDIQGNHHTR